MACRWDRVELLPTISDVRDLVVSWGSLFFSSRCRAEFLVLVLWDVRVFCEGLDSSAEDTLFWGKGFSIGQLVTDCQSLFATLRLS